MTAVEPTAVLPALPVLPAPVRPAPVTGRVHWRTPVRVALWTGLALAFVTVCVVDGLPTDRVVLLGWALGGLVAHAAVDGWRRVVRLLVEWLPVAALLLADRQGQVNQVAAVPSLHIAFAVLTCLVLLPVARRIWQRVALVAYTLLMPLVLVWAGEHYVVDTLLGAAYAVVVVLVATHGRRALARVLRTPTVTGWQTSPTG